MKRVLIGHEGHGLHIVTIPDAWTMFVFQGWLYVKVSDRFVKARAIEK